MHVKLYGMRMSNYYSLVKALLIEKDIDFEEIVAPPARDEDTLARSPMGKMPSIEVDGRFMSESLAIYHFLEAAKPTPAFLPADPFEAGKAMELTCHIKLDVELVARRFLPEVLFKKPVSDETKEQVKRDLESGMRAVSRLAVCDPFIAGKEFTIADLYANYSLGLAAMLTKSVIGVDLLADAPEMVALLDRLKDRPSIARVTAEAAS